MVGPAGVLNVVVLIVAGAWMKRSTARAVFRFGTMLRGVGATTMALVGLMTSPALALAAIAMLVTYQGLPIPRLAVPDLVAGIVAAVMSFRWLRPSR